MSLAFLTLTTFTIRCTLALSGLGQLLTEDHGSAPSLRLHLPQLLSRLAPNRLKQSLPNVLPNHRLHTTPIQRLTLQVNIAVQEKRRAEARLLVVIHDAMARAAVVSRRPLLHHVAHVDDVRAGHHGHRNPGLRRRVPYFEADGTFFLQKN
jgi:hypothetical protein